MENLNGKNLIKSLQLEFIRLKSENKDTTEIKNKIEGVLSKSW